MRPLLIVCLALLCMPATAQVNAIKGASKSNSGKSGESISGGLGFEVFYFLFDGLGYIHAEKTKNRDRYPAFLSLDVNLQGAIQPSSYYVIQPRIRGTWGLFSSDFRMSYLIEEDVDGWKHIRTSDWQIFQLNLITNRFLTLKVGTGALQEEFGDRNVFSESGIMVNVHAPDQSKLLGFEFRFAIDGKTNTAVRQEFNVQYQHQVFQKSILHGYVSLGGLYQRHYESINVWGIQTGLVFRLF